MKKLRSLAVLAFAALGATNCGGDTGGANGHGGAMSAGGATASSPGSGGMSVGTGGGSGTGGTTVTGGTSGTDAGVRGSGGSIRNDAGPADVASGGWPATGGTGGTPKGGAGGGPRGTGGTVTLDATPGAGGTAIDDGSAIEAGATSERWSMGYYANWAADQYPISEIEWSGLTHIAMAFYLPQSNGALTLSAGNAELVSDLITATHAHGVKAIASIGGSDSKTGFQSATASATVATFASNLVALVTTTGYDGIDIDWEPLDKADEPAVIDIANRIRRAAPSAMLTIPIGEINVNLGADLSGYPAIAAAYDQLNIMSYGQAGAWSGWKSWHSSALYHKDSATPTSIDSTVKLYLAANVPAAKLGIGIGFYGLCYSPPVTGPDQALNGSTLVASDGAISYASIVKNYYSADARKWDDLARVPYLSFTSAHAPDGCGYVSYDDEQSIAEKGAYVKAQGLGGVIQWELNEGYLSTAPAGQRNPLLMAIRNSVLH